MDEIVNKCSHGELLGDSIFRFYQPKVPVQLEVVFVHGLDHDNCGDVYWKTWLAQDGTLDNVWPMTWLPDEFSSAKIFALKYDASTKKTATDGRMDLILIGEKLVQEMVEFGEIGQNGVPVVFVCHGFGGLVAKQIVASAKHHFSEELKAQKLLKNIEAILFYSTPHHGSHVVESLSYFDRFLGGRKGLLLEDLEVLNRDVSRLNQTFEHVAKQHSWIFSSTAETHLMKPSGKMMVEEASSRYESGNYLALNNDHFDVVKPKTKKDSSYLLLTNCLKEILERYVVKLAIQVESLIPDGFVRLDVQEKALKKILQEVSIVGLVGMGGIGKTTLAKAMYHSIRKNFESSCYLNDVKSKASLDEVLIILLKNFGIKDRKTSCIVKQNAFEDCKENLLEDLKMYVQQHKVLVVIDDVGTKENFLSLLKDMNFLKGKKESKVIVTCRNWQVLKGIVHLSGRYEVQPMKFGQDIELFAYHAFKGARTLKEGHQILLEFLSKDSSEHLIDGFQSMCNDVVKACGGLPLSLEVMGCCLGGYLIDDDLSSIQCLKYWEGALAKLKRAEPLEGGVDNDKLWKLLELSYSCLHENEKNMFLNIACFFRDSVQYGEETLIRIWGSDPSKKNEFKNLKERCLVKINKDDGCVTIHDQLRDMGRSIVRRQSKGILSKMTRLWDLKDVTKLLQSTKIEAQRIQGLSLEEWGKIPIAIMEGSSTRTSNQQETSKWKGFSLNCPEMRFLNLYEVNKIVIEAITIEGSPHIQWLCLKGTNISKLPMFVKVCNELCVLDMRNCRYLENLDESIWSVLVNLTELDISWCKGLTSLPKSIGNLINLFRLDISGCEGLTSLPSSIGKLVNLSQLDISWCRGLTSLPDSIGNLINLSQLDISWCQGLTSLPDSIGNLIKLPQLDISCCEGLTSLPNSIGNLVNLSQLRLYNCKGLTSLSDHPNSIGKLVKLSRLDISGCEGLTSLPDSLCKLVNLSQLDISHCVGLTSLPHSIGNLVKLSQLQISSCERLTSLPDSIGKLVNLSQLRLFNCKGLTSLSDCLDSIGKLVKLSQLDIFGCEGLTSLPDSIVNLVNLYQLNISWCDGLTSLSDSIGTLVNLSQLHISWCEGLTSLPSSISELVNLSQLHISWCEGLTSLPSSISELVNLSQLDISSCDGLTSLSSSIVNLVNLSQLDISWCEGLTSLPDSIGNLVNLSQLDISCCKGLTSLPNSIVNLVNLSQLDISGCVGLTSLPNSIGKLVNLSQFNISGCKGLTSLPGSISELVNLFQLDISSCEGLTSLPSSIVNLVNLSQFDISWCKGLASLRDSISNLVKLSQLDISSCEGLTSLPSSIGKLVNLSQLDISSCEGLTSLPGSIGKLVNLSQLDISWCKGLASLPDSIGNLVNLSQFKISNCKGLISLSSSIGELVNLSQLHISWCKELTSLPNSIGNLLNLSQLHISWCQGLTSLPDSIGKLVNLSQLRLFNCKGLTSLSDCLDSIGKLVKLSQLDISGCEGLTSLPDSIGELVNLSQLDISSCKGLTSLPGSIGKLVNLSQLHISSCEGLTSLPNSIGKLVNLSQLDTSSCEGLTSLPSSIGKLVNLSQLDISWCKGLASLPNSIGNLVNLSQLNIFGCEGLTNLPNSSGKLVN